jgi:hypothetical protein
MDAVRGERFTVNPIFYEYFRPLGTMEMRNGRLLLLRIVMLVKMAASFEFFPHRKIL